jgi:hypothetical protein
MKRINGTPFQTKALPQKRGLPLRGDDGRQYFAKSTECPNVRSSRNPTWVANELIYYLIAQRSGLPMPRSCLIEYQTSLYFGSEYIPGRDAIRQNEAYGNRRLDEICTNHPAEAESICRALLLDLALLNSDRKPWNILVDSNSSLKTLYFFDHDKALLGDGKDNGDLWRIRLNYPLLEKSHDYLACSGANRVVASRLSDQEVFGIFNSLKLDSSVFPDVRSLCPPEWLSSSLLEELFKFLERWWSSLRKKFHEDPSYFRTVLGADERTV